MIQALKLILITLMLLIFVFGSVAIFGSNFTDGVVKNADDLTSTTVTFKEFKLTNGNTSSAVPSPFTVQEYPDQLFVILASHPLVRFSEPDWQFKSGDKLILTVPKKELQWPKRNPVVMVNAVSLPDGKRLTGIELIPYPKILYYISDSFVIIPILYFLIPVFYRQIIQKNRLRMSQSARTATWLISILFIFLVLCGIVFLINRPGYVPPPQMEQVIQTQIQDCWDIPPNLTAEQKIPVEALIEINRDHTIQNVKIVDQERFSKDRNFQVIAQSALDALKKPQCIHLDVPDSRYEDWKQIDFTFDPR